MCLMKNSLLIAFFFLLPFRNNSQNPVIVNLLNDVRIDSMKSSVRKLTGLQPVFVNGVPDTIKTRHAGTTGNEIAFAFIKKKFQGFGLAVDSGLFSNAGKNIIGTKTGYRFPGRRFILGAHYDSFTPTISAAPGADDNASGTAALIEAARIFSNYNFPYTIQFIGWDNEEQGLVGSNAFVSNLTAIDTIIAYLNMDMLAWDGNNDSVADIHVRPVGSSFELMNRAISLNQTYSIGLTTHVINPGGGSTDHAPFWNAGLSAIGFEEEHHSDGNPFWHTLGDSLSQFNLKYYEKVAKLAYVTLANCVLDTLNAVGIQDLSLENGITFFPNPVNSELTISITKEQVLDYEILNTLGQVKQKGKIQFPEKKLDVSDLPTGIYFLKIYAEKRSYTRKFMKLIE